MAVYAITIKFVQVLCLFGPEIALLSRYIRETQIDRGSA